MLELKKRIKTIKNYNQLMESLTKRVISNSPISENGMKDGVIIGLMNTNQCTFDIIKNNYIGSILDNTYKQLEIIIDWIIENEKCICDIYDEFILYKNQK